MDEQEYQQQLRQNRIDRLQALTLKQSIFGRNIAAEDLVEIAKLQKELGMAELAIASPISGQFADELGPSGQFQVLTQQNEQFTKRFNDAMTYLGERMASIEANTTKRLDNSVAYLGERITTVEANSEEWRHTERAARKEGHASYRATFRGIVLFLFLVAAGLIALTIVVLMRGSS